MAVTILLIMLIYAAAGALFAACFLWRGIEGVDPSARGSPWTFRLLIAPGVVALWPMLAVRWRARARVVRS